MVKPALRLGYDGSDLGLTNQKIALIGLAHRARRENAGLSLPPFVSFNIGDIPNARHRFAEVFNFDEVTRTLNAFSIFADDCAEYERINPWECFLEGADRYGDVGTYGPAQLSSLTCQLVKSLQPKSHVKGMAHHIRNELNALGASVSIQMRIEKDWQDYSANVLSGWVSAVEERLPSFREIIEKCKSSFGGEFKSAYVLCDENALPITKDEIRAAVIREYGVNLYWKSDFLTRIQDESNLTLSMVDFDVAMDAPVFVGNCRSTFSCFVSFEKYCKDQRPVSNHYIYNFKGPGLALRVDNGTGMNPHRVVDKLWARAPLMQTPQAALSWPMKLHAHISNVGEFESQTSTVRGAAFGDLVVGDPSDSSSRHIEGFSITGSSDAPLLEYRAQLSDGSWTAWSAMDEYAGTRGQSIALSGFAIRVCGPASLLIDVIYAGKFRNSEQIVMSCNGEDCKSLNQGALLAIHLAFRRKSAASN